MNMMPLSKPDRTLVTKLQDQIDELRRRFQISERGAVLYQSDVSYADDGIIVVEADGFGGARLVVAEGNYPVDYSTHDERMFETESEAVEAAEIFALKTSVY